MFAPVVMRFATYGVALGPVAARYCESVRAAPGVRAWVEGAAAETEFVPEDEPYADPPRP
jgi:glutathione S-transferase